MRTRRFLIAPAIVAVAFAAAGCDSVRPSALKVDGTEVSRSSVDRELEAIADNEAIAAGGQITGPDGTLNSAVTAYWLTLRVEQEVIDEEVERRDLDVTAADRDSARADVEAELGADVFEAFPEWLRDRLLDRYQRRAALVREVGGGVTGLTDEQVQATYDEFVAQQKAQCPSGRFVAHILVETQPQADALAAELAAGADFATLARENSVDGSSADGGELGCFDPAQFVAEFSTAAGALAPGAVSAPVPTEFGFHLIKISDTIPFAAIEPGIRDQLEQQAGAARNPEIDALVAGAKVRVDPRYGTWKVRDGLGTVEAPDGAAPATTGSPVPSQPSP